MATGYMFHCAIMANINTQLYIFFTQDDGSSSTGSVQSLPRVVTNPSYTKLMRKVHDSLIGEGLCFNSIFGEKRGA